MRKTKQKIKDKKPKMLAFVENSEIAFPVISRLLLLDKELPEPPPKPPLKPTLSDKKETIESLNQYFKLNGKRSCFVLSIEGSIKLKAFHLIKF